MDVKIKARNVRTKMDQEFTIFGIADGTTDEQILGQFKSTNERTHDNAQIVAKADRLKTPDELAADKAAAEKAAAETAEKERQAAADAEAAKLAEQAAADAEKKAQESAAAAHVDAPPAQ